MSQTQHLSHIEQFSAKHKALWVDAAQVAFFQIEKPQIPKRNWGDILRWQLEDLSPEDPVNWHIVALDVPQQPNNLVLMACPNAVMDEWQQSIENTHVKVLVPDLLAIPYQQDSWSVLQEGDTCKVRIGEVQGFVLHKQILYNLLRKLDKYSDNDEGSALSAEVLEHEFVADSLHKKPTKVILYQMPNASNFKLSLKTIALEQNQVAENWEQPPSLKYNLLVGAYRQRIQWRKKWLQFTQSFSPVVIMLFFIAVMAIVFLQLKNQQQQQQIAQYNLSLHSSFSGLLQFPYDNRVTMADNIDRFTGLTEEVAKLQDKSVLLILRFYDDLLNRCGSQCRVIKISGGVDQMQIQILGQKKDIEAMQKKAAKFLLDGYSNQFSVLTASSSNSEKNLFKCTLIVQKLVKAG